LANESAGSAKNIGDEQVEAFRLEGVHGCVRKREVKRQTRRRDLPRPRQHGGRNVDAKHMPARTDLLRERNRCGAAAAANIDDPLARSAISSIDQNFGNRRKHDVLRLLSVRPALAARAVPVRYLVSIEVVANRYLHRALIGGVFGFRTLC